MGGIGGNFRRLLKSSLHLIRTYLGDFMGVLQPPAVLGVGVKIQPTLERAKESLRLPSPHWIFLHITEIRFKLQLKISSVG